MTTPNAFDTNRCLSLIWDAKHLATRRAMDAAALNNPAWYMGDKPASCAPRVPAEAYNEADIPF